MSRTLADVTQFCKDRFDQDSSTEALREYVGIGNMALARFYAGRQWDFAKRLGTLKFNAPYSTGTASVNAAGTAVTGSGTTWTAAMAGRFIYFNGELRGYLISAWGSVTGLTLAEAYLGDSNLAAVTYEILEERVALPARFREFRRPTAGSVLAGMWPVLDISRIMVSRRLTHILGEPESYGVEWVLVSSVPAPYLWLYPPPTESKIIDFFYHVMPPALAVAGDELELPADPAYWECFKRFLLVGIEEKKSGQTEKTQAALVAAERDADRLCGDTRPITENSPGRMPYGTQETRSFRATIDPGVLAYDS